MPQCLQGILIAKNGIINHIEKLRNKCYQRPSFFLDVGYIVLSEHLLTKTCYRGRNSMSKKGNKKKMLEIRKINETLVYLTYGINENKSVME